MRGVAFECNPFVQPASDPLGELLERGRRVLPQDWPFGAVWATHHDGGAYPHFAASADGGSFRDVTGREYLDWFVGGGVVTLGHRHPAVQQAIAEQLERGVHLSLPSGLEVDVAERLCALFPGAEQVAFGKNGVDVTSAAVRLARTVTGREDVLISGYHGWQDWCQAGRDGVSGIPRALRELVHEFGYNELGAAEALMQQRGDRVAAIVVEPVRHALPDAGFLAGLRRLADAHGSLLVFDEIVTGLRVARGGAQALYGVQPDLTCVAKSIANGLPLAALLGRRRFMKHLPSAFFALTYAREALSLAAAHAALDVYVTEDVSSHLERIGAAVQARFAAAAERYDLPFRLAGHPTMPHMHFERVGDLTARGAAALFVESCQRAGVYLQPHRVLPCLAHTDADVERTAGVVAGAMRAVREAARDGLAPRLDSPVWGDFERRDPESPPPWRRRPLAAGPWLAVPPAIEEAGAVAVETVDGPEIQHTESPLPLLRVARGAAGHVAIRAIDLRAELPGDFRAAARYRFVEWQPGNTPVAVALVLVPTGGRGSHEVAHRGAFGQTPRVDAALAGTRLGVPIRYGTAEAELGLVRSGNVLSAIAVTHDGREEILSVTVEPRPVRIRFCLRVPGRTSGPVAVELAELLVDTGDLPG